MTDSAELLSLVHDLQTFIEIFNVKGEEQRRVHEALIKEYGITDEDWDDGGGMLFNHAGIDYRFEPCQEELFLESDEDLEHAIKEGPAYEYAWKYWSVVQAAYTAVETEMDRRDWYYDQEEYGYHLVKEEWSCHMPYFCKSMDQIESFKYEPDQPGWYYYRPLSEIIQHACRQLIGYPQFKLSDLEVSP